MKRSRFTEAQIVSILHDVGGGTPLTGPVRKHGVHDDPQRCNVQSKPLGKTRYVIRYIVRQMKSTAEVERQLTALSTEDWQPVNFVRSDDGSYEVILRRDDRKEHAAAVLESLEASAPEIRTETLP